MSRLEIGAKQRIVTFQYFTDSYKEIISERDKSFYKTKDQGSELDNFSYVINKYTGNDYWKLNNYLRYGKVSGFSEDELKSWAYCLHSSLQYRTSNVSNGTRVYRGVKLSPPSDWKIGKKFYFGEFVSTSTDEDVAESFSDGGTLMEIKIKNNGTNGRNNYCRYVGDISDYSDEEEVLITAFCIFKITDIEGNYYYLDCEGN